MSLNQQSNNKVSTRISGNIIFLGPLFSKKLLYVLHPKPLSPYSATRFWKHSCIKSSTYCTCLCNQAPCLFSRSLPFGGSPFQVILFQTTIILHLYFLSFSVALSTFFSGVYVNMSLIVQGSSLFRFHVVLPKFHFHWLPSACQSPAFCTLLVVPNFSIVISLIVSWE
jgi:hypothetical protein